MNTICSGSCDRTVDSDEDLKIDFRQSQSLAVPMSYKSQSGNFSLINTLV